MVILNTNIAFDYYYFPLRPNYSNYKPGVKHFGLNSELEYYYYVPPRSNYSNYKSGIKYSGQSQSLHPIVHRASLINNCIIKTSTVANHSKSSLTQILKTLKVHNTQEKKQIKRARAKQKFLLTISFYFLSVLYSGTARINITHSQE